MSLFKITGLIILKNLKSTPLTLIGNLTSNDLISKVFYLLARVVLLGCNVAFS